MKLLQRLVRQLEQLCLNHGERLRVKLKSSFKKIAIAYSHLSGVLSMAQAKRSPPRNLSTRRRSTNSDSCPKPNPTKPRQFQLGKHPQRLILVLAILSLTSTVGHRFYNAPELNVGKAAPQTILAPASATIEDTKATDEKRKAARKTAVSVLMLDQAINRQIRQTLQHQLEQGSELRRLAGPFPFTQTANLSLPVQAYLRRTRNADWQKILNAANTSSPSALARFPSASQQRAVKELQAYRNSVSPNRYLSLTETIEQARIQYSTALNALPQPQPPEATFFDTSLFDLTDADWQRTQARTLQVVDRILAQGIPLGLPEAILTEAVKLQVKDWVPAAAAPISTKLLLALVQPNLVYDEEQTRLTADLAAQEVKPEIVTIRAGEAIIYANEAISSADFALLDHFGLSRRGVDWFGLIWFGALVGSAIGIYCFVGWQYHPGMGCRDHLLVLLLTLSTPLMIALRVPSTNLPAVGLLVGSFYGSPLGAAVTALLAIGLPIGMEVNWSQLLSSAAGGIVCGLLAGRLRSREDLAVLGIGVGILQGTLYLLLNVVSGLGLYTLLGATAIQALIGLAWCIVALGVSPYLEQLFDQVTSIRLAELASPNRPLLKRLAAETPGTFQHTLFVATLAEAAAKALKCNVELVRAGTLYHDIGKMHDPQGFIENQMGGLNKHDLIDDPWKSAEIIKKHVTEGLVMARKFRLPKAVQAFIPQHQGTMLIAYFYHHAQQRMQQAREQGESVQPIQESDFRYDGPAPQSRETGIVMLADSCEAALRSLKDASREEALSMINKILRARWQDNQLVNSGLTRKDMSKIATIFVEVWQQSNHQRIAYPKAGVSSQPSVSSRV